MEQVIHLAKAISLENIEKMINIIIDEINYYEAMRDNVVEGKEPIYNYNLKLLNNILRLFKLQLKNKKQIRKEREKTHHECKNCATNKIN